MASEDIMVARKQKNRTLNNCVPF